MKSIIKLTAFCLLLQGLFTYAYSQKVELKYIDATKYPIISADFKVTEANGSDPRNVDKSSYQISDGGKIRQLTDISCPGNISAFSLILLMDRSYSMLTDNRLTEAKKAAANMIKNLPEGRSECAILAFSAGNPSSKLVHPFSTNKKTLQDSLNKLTPIGGTDYNAAFLIDRWGNPGALTLAKKARYKPIIVFLTDGAHDIQQSGQFRRANVIDSALNFANATIYCVTYGDEADEASINDLTNVSSSTGGEFFRNITPQDIDRIFQDILRRADALQYPPPCTISWLTDCDGGNVELSVLPPLGSYSTTATYSIPDSVKPFWEVLGIPRKIQFLNIMPGQTPPYKDTTITIKAKNNYANISEFISDPRWQIIAPTLPLANNVPEDGTIQVTLRYTPDDSLCHKSIGIFEGSACSQKDIELIAENVILYAGNVGSEEKGKTKKVKLPGILCNNTCNPITITGKSISGQNAADFGFASGADIGRIINSGECIEIEFSFAPSDVGLRQAIAELIVKGTEFPQGTRIQNEIIGIGIGNPKIGVPLSLTLLNADCKTSSRDTIIVISNTGGSDLSIQSLEITQTSNAFSFTSGNPAPFVIPSGDKYNLTITFTPQLKGLNTAQLIVRSDAENGNEKTIDLSGSLDSIDYSASVAEIDFGVICPDSLASRTFKLNNSGNVRVKINSVTSTPFSSAVSIFDINPGESPDFVVSINSPTEGDFTGTIEFTDDYCNYKKTVILRVKVESPKISVTPSPLVISSTMNVPKQDKLTITNTSGRDISIKDLIPQNAQFKIVNTSANIILAGQSIDVTVEYTPNSIDPINTTIELYGSPCDFTDIASIKLIGNPDKSLATISIDKGYQGIIGDVIPIQLRLKNKLQFAQSGAKTISTVIRFNPAVLSGESPYPAANVPDNALGVWTLNNIPTNSSNNDEVIATLNFKVLNSTVSCSDLEIDLNQTSADTKNVNFLAENGEFCNLISSADISIDENLKAQPGEVFDLNIYINNDVNLSKKVHQSISFDLKFNASIFEPFGATPKGNFDLATKIRAIPVTNLAIPENISGKTKLTTLTFRAMLGNAAQTSIELANPKSANGIIEFNSTSGNFSLNGLCEDGGKTRLFDPWQTPGILKITPNPADEYAEIVIGMNEKGMTQLILLDLFGNKIKTLWSMDSEPGERAIKIDTSELPSNTYMLILQTPTKAYSGRMTVIK